MNKFTKLILTTAVFATSGFASDVIVRNGATFETEKYTSGINVDVKVESGGTMNLMDDITLNEGKSITLEKGAVGSITQGKNLTNKGTIVMNYEDGKSTGLFPAGAGNIVQNYGSVTEQGYIIANLDNNGSAKWYAYKLPHKYDINKDGTAEDVFLYLFNKNSGVTEISPDRTGWYCISCVAAAYYNNDDYKKAYSIYSSLMWELSSFTSLTSTTPSAFTDNVQKVTSTIQINGIDEIAYYAGSVSALEADSTDLSSGNLSGKSAKKITTNSTGGFTPDIPGKIASVSYNDNTKDHNLTADIAEITDQSSLDSYFTSFGVSFKKADGTANATTSYADAKPVIDAIEDATENDAVLVDNTAIDVATNKTIKTNLHNIGIDSAAPSFTGTGELTLSGDNTLLTNATLECPVKISGQNAIPTNATFKKTLNIAEKANIPSGSEVTVQDALSVESGKTLEINGKLILKN